jgi:hypothetical protein
MSGIEIAMLASAAASLAAGGIGAAGTIAQGNAQLAAAKNEREQMNRIASEELAVATRGTEAKAKEVRGLQSRVQAVAASSGGRATDDTVLNIIGDIAKEGNVQQRDILRSGQVKSDDLMYRGRVGVNAARQNKSLSKWMAGGQMLSAAGDAFAKYGSGGPGMSVSPSQQEKPWYAKFG